MEDKELLSDKQKDKPWYGSWMNSRARCNNPNNHNYKNYGGRGIKHDLSFYAMGYLWGRDNAKNMKHPTIDRKDNDGDYTFVNCRFIERTENIIKGRIGSKLTQETKDKISASMQGHKISDETKKKMSDSRKRYFARIKQGDSNVK